ncbi:UDP-glucose 4-epimerase GalE [Cylindrospermopsis raciborskii CENA303]|uniref:UDP-glucose 4-epimerase n=1 Tax=Cylindrospermopsis raciborskii CENA303 TaxID=1170769 RepID=A0A1X4G6G4_9CYAN|nr:UDP-glucose 4-epimerase GalE [Cylindrospermopsis raciborskii]OSO90599.1 UDP-glucose 4-epimerase GalE [Cylindrospermopsis raciborskii CENA303]
MVLTLYEKPRKCLVVGGAGYIGSHVVLTLNEAGYHVTVFDNLSTGLESSVLSPAKLIVGDLNNLDHLEEVIRNGEFDAILHFAASIVVSESITDPLSYYTNNVVNTINLLTLAHRYRIPRFIFSSSAAVYGITEQVPVPETAGLFPISPYGRTKLVTEWAIQDLARSAPWFSYGILRYFNVAGCQFTSGLGGNNSRATHVIKLACQTALGKRPVFQIYGSDYPTADGTGVRDFIHVTDLSQAHLSVLNYLEDSAESSIFNCGYGQGYSVLDVIKTVQEVSGVKFPIEIVPRRIGDPPEVVADVSSILQRTSWQPQHNDLKLIIQSAWNWEKGLMNNDSVS